MARAATLARLRAFEIDSGHFAFLDHAEECERAIASWLRERERDAPGRSSPAPLD